MSIEHGQFYKIRRNGRNVIVKTLWISTSSNYHWFCKYPEKKGYTYVHESTLRDGVKISQ